MVDSINENLQTISPQGTPSRLLTMNGLISVGVVPNGAIYLGGRACDLDVFVSPSSTKLFSGAFGSCSFIDGSASTARYASPNDLAVDAAGNLYVADTANYRIRKVTSDGTASTLAGSIQGHKDGIGADAQFEGPTGLAIDNQQHLVYVADGSRIRVIASDGTTTTVVGSTAGAPDGNVCVAKFAALHGIAFFGGERIEPDRRDVRFPGAPGWAEVQ